MNAVEIELRYEILADKNIAAFLAPLTLLHKKHDIDLYFDTPDGRHFGRGVYIRVRNGKKLEIKFNRACLEDPELPHQDFCEEHAFALPLCQGDLGRLNALLSSIDLNSVVQADFDVFKSANNLDVYYTIDKVRASYRHGVFTVAIDEVKDLGKFLEIELMANDSQELEKVRCQMLCALAGLILKESFAGYPELMMRKKNFAQYLRGRFVLEEDRQLNGVCVRHEHA